MLRRKLGWILALAGLHRIFGFLLFLAHFQAVDTCLNGAAARGGLLGFGAERCFGSRTFVHG
jgi:hypothetical protein